MAMVKVRHALISWVDEESRRVLTAFRGQNVDLPEGEINRLRPHGAVVPSDDELERPGSLLELPQSPTDEELVNWVLSASPTEIAMLSQERPELHPRIEGAVLRITDERSLQEAHLASVREALQGVGQDATILPPTDGAATGDDSAPTARVDLGGVPAPGAGNDDIIITPPPGGPPNQQPATGGGEEPVPPPVAPTDVVKGNVAVVSDYLAQHPEMAQAVLDAETAATDGQPRAGVVQAVRAAAAFTQQ